MPLKSPRDLFIYDLSSIHSAEQLILQQISQMEQMCQNSQVKQLLSHHLTETQQQVTRVQECFRLMGIQPMNVTSYAVDCMRQDTQEFIRQQPSPELIDLFCLEAVDKTKHFEIASYGGLIEKARSMGETQVVSLLEDTLREEEHTAQQVEQLSRQLGSQVIQRMQP